jgi:hypothetical protein
MHLPGEHRIVNSPQDTMRQQFQSVLRSLPAKSQPIPATSIKTGPAKHAILDTSASQAAISPV